MSYSGNESLDQIIHTLREKLSSLKKMLWEGQNVETLHGTVEMLEVLIMRYDRKEIVDLTEGAAKLPQGGNKKKNSNE